MVFVLLCGGLGTRMTQGTLPKPHTPHLGSPSHKFALEHIAPLVPEIIFIYAKHLTAYNFEETVINLFKGTKCIFTCVPFATRGAVETALAGLLQLALPADLPLVFLDNDNVYPASLATLAAPATPFLGFGEDTSELASFSFMRRDACGRVLEFVEKRRISNEVCNGVYGFSSAAQFLHWGRHTLRHGPFPKGEIYMSSLFVNMIAAGERVDSAPVPVVQLGTAAFAAAVCTRLLRTEFSRARVAIRAVIAVRIAQGMSAITRNQNRSLPAIDRCIAASGLVDSPLMDSATSA
jgi:NDP-sugar pyrophosphorylase family protein